MRILFLTHQYFPRHIGGTEMVVRGLASRLRERGDEAVVLTYVESESGHLPDLGFRVTEFEGVAVWELHWNLSIMPHPAEAEFHNPMIAELVARAAREIAPDVVHAAHVMKLSAAVVPRLKREGLPVIVSLSDFWPLCLRHTLLKPDAVLCETGPDHPHRCLRCAQATHGFAQPQAHCADESELRRHAAGAEEDPAHPDAAFRRDVLALARRTDTVREAMLQADRLLALSDFQRRLFIKHGWPADRIQVLRHGVETTPLEPARAARRHGILGSAPRKMVFMGSLAPHKGPHVLIEALRAAPDARVTLQILGGPGTDAIYVERLHMLAAGDPRIEFHGVLPPERLGEALADAAAFALPALWFENEPLVVKAALYCGVPVAASRIGSLAEQVSEPDDGWLLPPGDVAAWADWLRHLAEADRLPVPRSGAVPTMDEFAQRMFLAFQELAAVRAPQ
jgi:glycosyltransferase involved in cell wall biosynthesis